jgi:hypothetical protein
MVRERELPFSAGDYVKPATMRGRTGSDQGWTAGVVETGRWPAVTRGGEGCNDAAGRQGRTLLLRQLGRAGPAIGMHAQLALQVRLGTAQSLVLVEVRRLRKSGTEHRKHGHQRHQPAQVPASQGA